MPHTLTAGPNWPAGLTWAAGAAGACCAHTGAVTASAAQTAKTRTDFCIRKLSRGTRTGKALFYWILGRLEGRRGLRRR